MRFLALIFVLFLVSCKGKDEDAEKDRPAIEVAKEPAHITLAKTFDKKLDSLLPLAKEYVVAKRFNDKVAFIADLSMHSGLPRFAVVDLKSDSILHKDLVSHGRGEYSYTGKALFSNTPNSRLSSLGRYRIGHQYNGQFGKAYKLYGMDKTNSKAFDRFIVLHAYECVPEYQLYPNYLCCSDGCPMVSYKFLDTLSAYIDKSSKPVLLWIIG